MFVLIVRLFVFIVCVSFSAVNAGCGPSTANLAHQELVASFYERVNKTCCRTSPSWFKKFLDELADDCSEAISNAGVAAGARSSLAFFYLKRSDVWDAAYWNTTLEDFSRRIFSRLSVDINECFVDEDGFSVSPIPSFLDNEIPFPVIRVIAYGPFEFRESYSSCLISLEFRDVKSGKDLDSRIRLAVGQYFAGNVIKIIVSPSEEPTSQVGGSVHRTGSIFKVDLSEVVKDFPNLLLVCDFSRGAFLKGFGADFKSVGEDSVALFRDKKSFVRVKK
ncbi:hypothetical protein HOD08_01255 [bacterium]|nr:hypothetical protein [bacterium]